ncbi:violacein biosynthesis enzyme VioE [Chromobacterium sphagni]|uniref:Violacein biosynthesis enzyme VioE n=1 Tax=Chromobacterium sphagni TaxID=1903179 RepID=A0ABX3C867_9NEIS|nr:violacein biosynthesis enzyme VioE [Chromobacterium sphagni]OHX17058.1 violacein biosynthesis enzyme VioE [Chromobacterium sphagni]
MTQIPPSALPLLPQQWSSAYVSYWSPMQPEDQLSSGYCWFDYRRNICRIDGLFNPWSEEDTGYRLWMSETGNAASGRTRKQKVAYGREAMAFGTVLCDIPLDDEAGPFPQLFLPRDVLLTHDAQYVGRHMVLGQEADAWTYQRPDKGPSTLYFQAGTGLLLRMVTGDDRQHASVRDFPNLSTAEIPAGIFAANDG